MHPRRPRDALVHQSINKSGIELSRYRCARDSTSLESFHCHLNRFIPGKPLSDMIKPLFLSNWINQHFFQRHLNDGLVCFVFCFPGTSANLLNFQLYLLEGLNRWNQDWGTAAVSSKLSCLLTYTGDMTHVTNMYNMLRSVLLCVCLLFFP